MRLYWLVVAVGCQTGSRQTADSATPLPTPSASSAAQDPIDKRLSGEAHAVFQGPVASLDALCKEINDDYVKKAKPSEPVAICKPGPTKTIAGGAAVEIGSYNVQLPRGSDDVFLAVRTSKGWFVQQRAFGTEPFGGGVSHHTPVTESIPLERARQSAAGLVVVQLHETRSYQPGMGNLGSSATTRESAMHCTVDAQGAPSCTAFVGVVSRTCTNGDPARDASCQEQSLL